jgi:phenylalanyl-tRNA synthetase beta chain
MATLDGVERTLTADDLLICDGEGPVAVAGVMGGLESEIRAETKHVLIECAYFDPRSIRRTSRRLGLHTDSSHRFERGVDPEAIPRVLASAASLIATLGEGAAGKNAIDHIAKPHQSKSIRLRPERAARLLGTPVSKAQSVEILKALGCRVTEHRGEIIEAQAPSWRPDLTREVDLIEEVARVRGYDQIPIAMPRAHVSELGTPGVLRLTDDLRDAAVASGLYEAVNYGFLSRDDLRKARVETDAVSLANPLSEERAVMRTSLLPGLTSAATRAQRRGASEVRLFEIARTFRPSGDILPDERTVLAIALAGQRSGWIGDEQAFDLYDGKGVVEAILDRVLGRRPDLVAGELPAFMHPKRSGLVTLASQRVGLVGEIHPEVADDLEMIGRVIYAELDVLALYALSLELGPPQARDLPKFPAVTRDIAMLVRDELSAGEIADALREASNGLAESVRLFDLYRGDQVPEGHRSLAFRVTYRDASGTLTDKQVDQVHALLAEVARDRFRATIR